MASPFPRPPEPSRPWPRALLQACAQRPRLACLPAFVATLAALLAASLLPQRYRASALVQVEWDAGTKAALERIGVDVADRELELVRQGVSGQTGQAGAVPAAASVAPEGKGRYRVGYEHADAATAALVSNRIAQLLVEAAGGERERKRQADPVRLAPRLVEARTVLDDALAALRRRQEGEAAGKSREPAPGRLTRESLLAQRRTVAASLSAARARAEGLRRSIEEAAGAQAAGSDVTAELDRLRADRAALRQRYTEEHPDVVVLDRRIRHLEAEAAPLAARPPGAEALEAELGRVEAEIEALGTRESRLDAEIARSSSRSPTVEPVPTQPQETRDLAALEAEVERARSAHAATEEELRSAELAWQLSPNPPPRLRLLEPASAPRRPHFRGRALFGLGGLAVGLALGLLAALVAERRDPSVKGPEDLQELLALPLLAEIPFVRVPRAARRGSSRAPVTGS